MKKRMLIGVDGSATKLQKTGDILNTATQVAGTIATVVAGMQNQKKRKEFEQALAYLSNDQEKALEKQLASANSDVQRIKILSDAVTKLQIERINAASNISISEEQKKRWNTILYVSGIMIVGGVMVYLIVKNA